MIQNDSYECIYTDVYNVLATILAEFTMLPISFLAIMCQNLISYLFKLSAMSVREFNILFWDVPLNTSFK